MDKFDICVIGAGVVGLAIAYKISESNFGKGKSIVILERESNFGKHTSSRNSEVIHAGIYYATDSLKTQLCVLGNPQLYQHCKQHDIPHQKIGKLIVGQKTDRTKLEAIERKAIDNGVKDLRWIEGDDLRTLEPQLNSELALLSPSTGIIDSHSYMQNLLHLAQGNGVHFSPYTEVDTISYQQGLFQLTTNINTDSKHERYSFQSSCVVNSGGLFAQALAAKIELQSDLLSPVPASLPIPIPPLKTCKGSYFTYSGRNPFRHLIYPLPEANEMGLGIHSTVDMSGQLKFGPDTEYVTELNYQVDPSKAEIFATSIANYFPAISAEKLSAAYAGIRPKIVGPNEPAGDFVIQNGQDFGVPGLIQLFGMESPALTASLAIGDYVSNLLESQPLDSTKESN